MDALRGYAIPVHSLKLGEHQFDFEVKWGFFRHFEGSPVEQGRFDVSVLFDKQPDHWHVAFDVKGTWDTDCDRCLAPIALPVAGQHWLIVKFEQEDGPEDANVVFVPRDERVWNIAAYLYEFILLSLPITRTYDCREEEVKPCDEAVLQRLEAAEGTQSTNPVWDALKALDKKS